MPYMPVIESGPLLPQDLPYARRVATELPVLAQLQVPRATISARRERGGHANGYVRDEPAAALTIATESDRALDAPPRRREVVRRRDLHAALPSRPERRHLLHDALAERTFAEKDRPAVILQSAREDL